MKWRFWQRSEQGTRRSLVSTPSAGTVVPSGGTRAGLVVSTPGQALTVSAVYRAVEYLGGQVAMLPCEPKRLNRAEGRFVDWDGTPLWRVLTVQADARLTAYMFWKTVVSDIYLHGNSVAVIERGPRGDVTGLKHVSPGSVGYDRIGGLYYIEDFTAGVSGVFERGEVLHFKNVSLDGGLTGVSTLTFARRVLSLAATSDQEQLDRVATGGRIKAVLTNAEAMGGTRGFGHYEDKELINLAGEINSRLSAGEDIIPVPGDGKLTPMSMTSTDLQFLESRKFNVSEIARFFGVPPSKLMDTTGAVYKSAESATNAFYVDTLAPLLTGLETELRAKLVSPELSAERKFEFNTSRLWSMDPASKARFESIQLQNGTMTVNELRKQYDKAPVAGGDELMVATQLANAAASSTPAATEEEGGE